MTIEVTVAQEQAIKETLHNIHSWGNARRAGVVNVEAAYEGIAREVEAAEKAGIAAVRNGEIRATAAFVVLYALLRVGFRAYSLARWSDEAFGPLSEYQRWAAEESATA